MKEQFKSQLNISYLRFLLKNDFKMMVVLVIIYFLAMPFTLFSTEMSEANSYFSHEFVIKGSFTTGTTIFIISCVIIPCLLFSFMMNRNKMDTYQSLPIKRQDLFLTHFIEALIVIFLPLLICWLLNIFVIYYKGVHFNILQSLYTLLKVFLFTPLLVGLTLFAFICSGRCFDGFIYGAALHISQFFSLTLFSELFRTRLFGLSNMFSSKFEAFFSYILALFHWAFDNIFSIWTLMWLLLSIGLYFLNQTLYSQRKTENIDDAAVFNWFIPVINTFAFALFISFLIFMFIYSDSYLTSLVVPLIMGLIFYLIVDAIGHRGFQHFYKALTRYIFLSGACVLLIYSIILTGLFGTTKSIPTTNQFDTVFLTIIRDTYREGVSTYDDNQDYSQYLTSPQKLSEIINDQNSQGIADNYIMTQEQDKQNVVEFHNNLVEGYYSRLDKLGNKPHLYRNDWSSLISNNTSNYGDFYQVYLTYINEKKVMMRRLYHINQHVFDQFYPGQLPNN